MTDLNVVTFNIRCFGFDGDYFGRNRAESRVPHLKSFIQSNFPEADVFVFQEIMNPHILDKILPRGFKTYTYQHDYARHMYVAFACREEFEINNFQTIPDTTIDDTKSRPAIYGELTIDGAPVLDLIGVHLKSKHDHTEERKLQARAIAKFIGKLPPERPKLMTGDFNSHLKERTFKSKDDLVFMQEIFHDQLILADHNKPTYLSPTDIMKLDHFFMSGVMVLDQKVYDLQDYSPQQSYKKYYDEISDHLPVSIKIQF